MGSLRDHANAESAPSPGCPVSPQNKELAECPRAAEAEKLNPATKMPFAEALQSSLDPTAEKLSAEREVSTIPREEGAAWQYPSARMFYNALQRKGKGVPAEAVDSMLAVHNYLNEAVWKEIVEHEQYLHPACQPKLKRFMGRPEDWTPRAWYHVKVRGGQPPFDRHDWVVDRCGCEVRYVIDYYSGDPVPEQASFNVDIRPALDTPQACLDRFRLFWRKTVGSANQQKRSLQ